MEAHKTVFEPRKEEVMSSREQAKCILGAIHSDTLTPDIADWYAKLTTSTYEDMDYLVLCGLLRFKTNVIPPQDLKAHLSKAWLALTGTLRQLDGPIRLPQSFLRKKDRQFRAYHAAIFLNDPITRDYNLLACFQDIVWEQRDFLVLTLTGIALCFSMGQQLVLGFLCGLFMASLNEMLTHRHVGHTGEKMMRFFDWLGKRGRSLKEISLAHKLHHLKVKEDFTVSFRSPFFHKQFEKLARDHFTRLASQRTEILDQGEESSKLYEAYVAAGYGVNATPLGSTRMFIAALPGYALFLLADYFFDCRIFTVTSCVFGSFFIFQSLFSHRYLHLNREDLASNKHETTWFMRWFMTTRVAQFQQRLHFVHHQYHLHDEYNDVIMTGCLADWVLKKAKAPNCQDLYKMDQQKFLDY